MSQSQVSQVGVGSSAIILVDTELSSGIDIGFSRGYQFLLCR